MSYRNSTVLFTPSSTEASLRWPHKNQQVRRKITVCLAENQNDSFRAIHISYGSHISSLRSHALMLLRPPVEDTVRHSLMMANL